MHKISACFGLYHRRCRHSKLIVSGAGSINGRVPVRQSVCPIYQRRPAGLLLSAVLRALYCRSECGQCFVDSRVWTQTCSVSWNKSGPLRRGANGVSVKWEFSLKMKFDDQFIHRPRRCVEKDAAKPVKLMWKCTKNNWLYFTILVKAEAKELKSNSTLSIAISLHHSACETDI